MLVVLTTAEFFYRATYEHEISEANNDIQELYQTVAATASIAAFLEDEDLAKEAINGLVKSEKILHFWVFGFLTYTIDTFCKQIVSKRPILPPSGSETIYTRLYGVATANSDDPHRNPKMNTRIIELGN